MLLKSLKVREAMVSNVPIISPRATLDEVARLLERYEIHAVPVVDGNRMVGIVAKQDAIRIICQDQSPATVMDIMSSNLIVTHPDESMFDAMNKMIVNHISQLPVVERNNPYQILGLLALDDVTRIQCSANVS
jgi:CBS domain-containing protein